MSAAVKARYHDKDDVINIDDLLGKPENDGKNSRKNRESKKSEVYPFEIEDVKKIMRYFQENNKHIHYLLFVLSCNMARRVGDMLALKWENFFDPRTGNFRKNIKEIKEDKTDKLANPRINSACRTAITEYISLMSIDVAKDNYSGSVFMQYEGTHKGTVLSYSGYMDALKKAGKAVGIEYNIGTHSARKFFGMMSRTLHPNDYDSMELLQVIFNHSDQKTTKRYIGLTREKIDAYYDDHGDFFTEYVIGDKKFDGISNDPTITFNTTDLLEIIQMAYKAGGNNAGNSDGVVHVKAMNSIMELIERLRL